MIRQAHTYLVGALSGVTLIGIAIAVFVVLVSAQVFHELPIVNVSGPDHKPAAISTAKALPAGGGTTTATTAGKTGRVGRAQQATNGGTLATAPKTGSAGNGHSTVTESGALADATGPTTAVEGAPSTSGGGTSSSGGNSGSHSSQPSPKATSPSPSSSPSGGGAPNSSGSSGSTGSAGSGAGAPGSTGSSGSSGSTGTGSGGTTTPTGPVTAGVKSASEELAGGINETVQGIDEKLLGGALEETGVTEVTEGAVNGVTAPESVVGQTVNGVTETVNGLVGSGSH